MQPAQRLENRLSELADQDHYLFTPDDLRALLPDLSPGAFRALLHRAGQGVLRRVCRGLYLYPRVDYPQGSLLFHAAARLRAASFNYISLETALSDAGVISQVPAQWVTLMSSGRSSQISCGEWGTIEFVHTRQAPGAVCGELSYDRRCGLWRASVPLALRDMRAARRDMDLIDWSVADEFVQPIGG